MPDPECADRVWTACNERLKEEGFSTREVLRRFGVKVLSTSDDLLDDVTSHPFISRKLKVAPSLRADSILAFDRSWFEKLGSPESLEEYLTIVSGYLDVFAQNGCRVADHALDDGWRFELAAYSLLPQFVGMTTDSRNVLSFSRHDYFRRVLCNWMADKVLRGLFPSDEAYLGQIAADMSYNNANNWFGL